MTSGNLWTQVDRFGNEIYLTAERWAHIVAVRFRWTTAPDGIEREEKFVKTAYFQTR